MEPINRHLLEEFTERHRADFDLHEPRPELWDALTARLDADVTATAGPQLRIATEETVEAIVPPVAAPGVAQPRLRAQRRWQPLGIAAALLALVLAAGAGEVWKSRQATHVAAATTQSNADDAALYLGTDALPASEGGPNGNARLDTAVHGMERYYGGQLAERQAQLSQLAGGPAAEWMHELASLDSSYQALKQELPRHPQPEVVLMAMNRNLQIRLDILDRQLELRGADSLARTAAGGGEYALADSRRNTNFLPANAR